MISNPHLKTYHVGRNDCAFTRPSPLKPEPAPLVKGGQGRTTADTFDGAAMLVWLGCIVVGAMAWIGLCTVVSAVIRFF